MNKSLKRFKRVKWIDTRLSRKYRTRVNLLPFHIAIKKLIDETGRSC